MGVAMHKPTSGGETPPPPLRKEELGAATGVAELPDGKILCIPPLPSCPPLVTSAALKGVQWRAYKQETDGKPPITPPSLQSALSASLTSSERLSHSSRTFIGPADATPPGVRRRRPGISQDLFSNYSFFSLAPTSITTDKRGRSGLGDVGFHSVGTYSTLANVSNTVAYLPEGVK